LFGQATDLLKADAGRVVLDLLEEFLPSCHYKG
jgi:hypothetical protein